jgi:hypothetical protein
LPPTFAVTLQVPPTLSDWNATGASASVRRSSDFMTGPFDQKQEAIVMAVNVIVNIICHFGH